MVFLKESIKMLSFELKVNGFKVEAQKRISVYYKNEEQNVKSV